MPEAASDKSMTGGLLRTVDVEIKATESNAASPTSAILIVTVYVVPGTTLKALMNTLVAPSILISGMVGVAVELSR